MDLALYISLQQCVTLLYACISHTISFTFSTAEDLTGRTQEATRDSLMQSRQTRVPKPEKKKKSCKYFYIYRIQPSCWSIRPEETAASKLFTSPSACDMITIELSCNATTSQQFLTFLFASRGNVFSRIRTKNIKGNFFFKKRNIGYLLMFDTS